MQLIVAEKPSVGRDLGRVLGVGGGGGGKGCLEGSQRVITWCIGHLVELDEPAGYDPKWKAWRLASLPMLPERFRLRVAREGRGQFEIVRRLMRDNRFHEVVNACDAGREGELIFRYVYELAGCRLPVRRLWVSSLTDEAVKGAFSQLRDGRAFDALGDAARCRSEADWLVGMNATRAITVTRRGQVYEKGKVWSIGRVQTPTLALLVERERAIREFVPKDYWEVMAKFEKTEGETDRPDKGFGAKWFRERVTRFARVDAAAQVVSRAETIGVGTVERVHQKKVREAPPLLFDLTSLQRTANRRFGMSASRTLEVAQSLYEKHKVLTYPRTDSRYLTKDLIGEMPKLFTALAAVPDYAVFAQALLTQGIKATKRVFDDARVSDHHAIVPTGKAIRLDKMDGEERRIFDLVARRFLGVFFPDAEFALTEIVVRVGEGARETDRSIGQSSGQSIEQSIGDKEEGKMLEAAPPGPDRFFARGKVRIEVGWQAVAGFGDDDRDGKQGRGEGDDEAASAVQALPVLVEGERLSGEFAAIPKRTRPPVRLTEATLLGAMESAGKSIDDEVLRQAMKDRGLGTPATRAATIETLLRRKFVSRDKKQLVPTSMGIELIERLPVPSLASPELTGEWEAKLARIARREERRADFMGEIAKYVTDVVEAVRREAPRGPDAPRRAPLQDQRFDRAAPPPEGHGVHYFNEASETEITESRTGKSAPRGAAKATTKSKLPVRKKREGMAIGELSCPRCGVGRMMQGRRGWGCTRWKEGCAFVVWFEIEGKRLTEGQLRELVTRGKTRKGAWGGRAGRLILDAKRDGGSALFVGD